MTPLATLLLFLGVFLAVLVLAKYRDWPPFAVTLKKREPLDFAAARARRQELEVLVRFVMPRGHVPHGPKGSRASVMQQGDRR